MPVRSDSRSDSRNDFDDVQRIVLVGDRWQAAQHLVIHLSAQSDPTRFLTLLMDAFPATPALASPPRCPRPSLQVSLGFSRRGLERMRVPTHALAGLAARAPAFTEGAPLRASTHAAQSGANGPACWDEAFDFMTLDAVLSLHAADPATLDTAVQTIEMMAVETNVCLRLLPRSARLPTPQGDPAPADHQYVHFGFRDGLSRTGIAGWSPPSYLDKCKPHSIHAAGEFILGHPQNSRANPWLSGDGRQVWPEELRAFFHNGSFGVLLQMEQHVAEFETYLAKAAQATGLGVELIRAKLCGRTAEGQPVGLDEVVDPKADFDYADDPRGERCPFGAHARRMNPRGGGLAQTRQRPLLRRGMPYTSPPVSEGDGEGSQGLVGLFFCASIEDQFEHLLAQWADRVPLGSADLGGARDPLIGAHAAGDGDFEIPLADGERHLLSGLQPFTRTRGSAYLFYPSVTVVNCIAANEVFANLAEGAA